MKNALVHTNAWRTVKLEKVKTANAKPVTAKKQESAVKANATKNLKTGNSLIWVELE